MRITYTLMRFVRFQILYVCFPALVAVRKLNPIVNPHAIEAALMSISRTGSST